MTFIPLPLGIKVDMSYTKLAKDLHNIMFVVSQTPITQARLLDVGNLFYQWWQDELRDLSVTAMSLNAVICTDASTANGEQVTFEVAPASPGLVNENPQPNNVALVTTLRTTRTGRSYRGRQFFAGLGDTMVSGNFVTTTYAAAMDSAYTALRTALTPEGLTLVVRSTQENNQPRDIAVGTPVFSTRTNTRVDTMKKRLP